MAELEDRLHQQIIALGEAGDGLAEDDDYEAALVKYRQAFDLLPEPKTGHDAGTWLLAAIGDSSFMLGDFTVARDSFAHAMHFPGAIGNSFIHLRLGQCHFELGHLDQAADELMRAYMGAGTDIFAVDDAKYLEFLATRAKDIRLPRKKPFWKIR